MNTEENEKIELTESLKYPGFYIVPSLKFLAISKKSEVINLSTGNKLTLNLNKRGYLCVSVGYKGKEYKFRAHRLIGLTFIGRPKRHLNVDYKDLFINHIDGVRNNNSIENLEWVTEKENTLHAIETRLIKFDTCLSRDIRNNLITSYLSSFHCAFEHDVNGTAMRFHVLSSQAGTRTKDWFVFKLDDGKPWPILTKDQKVKDSLTYDRGYWIAKNIITGVKAIHNTIRQLAEALSLNVNSVPTLYQKNPLKPIKNWLFSYIKTTTDEIKKQLPQRDKFNNSGIPIELVNVLTNEVKEFKSKNSLSVENSIPLGTINFYIDKSTHVWKDTWIFRTKK
jgi:hypothetical protein